MALYRIGNAVVQAELHGVLPVHKCRFEPLQKSAFRWSNRLKQAVAVCNSLTYVNKGTVAGADMERSMFKAVEARFLVPAAAPNFKLTCHLRRPKEIPLLLLM